MIIVREFSDPLPKYRKGIENCPHCGHTERINTFDVWFCGHRVREIILDPKAQYARKDSAMVSSECPKCFGLSFHHLALHFSRCSMEDWGWPKDIVKAIKAEYSLRLRNAKRQYKKSLCAHCAVENTPDYLYLSPAINCAEHMCNFARTKREGCRGFREKEAA